MGIVVTVAMLLGLVILRPTPWRGSVQRPVDLRLVVFTTVFLLTTGLWNVFWYGLQNFGSFWGAAALVSGIAMVLSAFIIFLERGDPAAVGMTWITSIRGAVIWVLIASFLLYSITLIQLNLGYKIIS